MLYWHCTSPRYGDIKFEYCRVEYDPSISLKQPLLTNKESMKETARPLLQEVFTEVGYHAFSMVLPLSYFSITLALYKDDT